MSFAGPTLRSLDFLRTAIQYLILVFGYFAFQTGL